MGHKVFVSYKYADANVQALTWRGPTYVHDYVRYIEQVVLRKDVYKGEKQDEDLSIYSEAYIWNHLKDKIYDSSITIVLVSPNMKDPHRYQKSQWIPWEISYSLRLTTRDDRTSQRNALLVVVLPDRYGSYRYYDPSTLFPILRTHITNGYAKVVDWGNFCKYPQYYMNAAYACKKEKYHLAAPQL